MSFAVFGGLTCRDFAWLRMAWRGLQCVRISIWLWNETYFDETQTTMRVFCIYANQFWMTIFFMSLLLNDYVNHARLEWTAGMDGAGRMSFLAPWPARGRRKSSKAASGIWSTPRVVMWKAATFFWSAVISSFVEAVCRVHCWKVSGVRCRYQRGKLHKILNIMQNFTNTMQTSTEDCKVQFPPNYKK